MTLRVRWAKITIVCSEIFFVRHKSTWIFIWCLKEHVPLLWIWIYKLIWILLVWDLISRIVIIWDFCSTDINNTLYYPMTGDEIYFQNTGSCCFWNWRNIFRFQLHTYVGTEKFFLRHRLFSFCFWVLRWGQKK
jgi:hypothetical protein